MLHGCAFIEAFLFIIVLQFSCYSSQRKVYNWNLFETQFLDCYRAVFFFIFLVQRVNTHTMSYDYKQQLNFSVTLLNRSNSFFFVYYEDEWGVFCATLQLGKLVITVNSFLLNRHCWHILYKKNVALSFHWLMAVKGLFRQIAARIRSNWRCSIEVILQFCNKNCPV